ncbi:VCBS domain-containing protein, partial [Bradyrhizobium diazoefficiens]
NAGTIEVLAYGALAIDQGSAVTNTGNVTVDANGKLTLNGATIAGAGTVTGNGEMDLTDASINGGSLNNSGKLYGVSGLNTITAAVTNTGAIEVQDGTLNLAGGLTGVGTLTIDDGGTLELAGADAQTVAFAGGTNTLQLDKVTGQSFTGTIAATSSQGGTFTITGAADILTSVGDALDFTASGGTGGSAGNIVLMPTGTLTGYDSGIVIAQNGIGNVTLTTSGAVTGQHGSGIVLHDGANGAGDITATIGGAVSGAVGLDVLANGDGDVTITNNGHVTGTDSFGISVTQNDDGATHITNTGSVVGADGYAAISIQENGSATIDNSGTIGPDNAGSVTATTYAIVETGGPITINNTGYINGNISVATATFDNKLDGTWTVSGTSVFGTLSTIDNLGTINLHDGASISGADGLTFDISSSGTIGSWGATTITGAITSTGTIEVHDGDLTLFGSLSGSGSVTVDAVATLTLEGSVSQTISLAGNGAELVIDTTDFGGSIADLTVNDKIDLTMIKWGPGTTADYVPDADHPENGGVLTVTGDDGHTISLTLVGDYRNTHFAGSDEGGHTLITINADDSAPELHTAGATLSADVYERETATGDDNPNPTPAATGTIAFTDVDLTDRPTATITTQTATWLDGGTPLDLTPAQEAALEQALTLQQSGHNNGTVTWSYSIPDSTLDFLGEGQTVTLLSTIRLEDADHKFSTANVSITINGKNDAPAITAEKDDSASANLTETNAGFDKTGTLTVSDADATDHVSIALDHVCVYLDGVLQTGDVGGLSHTDLLNYLTVPSTEILDGTSNHGQFTWEFNSHDQAFDFLAAGQTLSLQYTIVPNDGHTTGAGDIVTITIAGSNDAPTLGDATLASVAGDDSDPAGSAISALFTDKFHDVDTGATFKAIAVTSDAATADQGVWQYELAGTSQWVDIGSVSDAQALVLSPDTLIRFLPADGFTGTPTSLGVHALDDTYAGDITSASGAATTDITGGKGGTTPISDALTTISTDVAAPENGPAANGPVINTEFFHVETNHESIPETDTIIGLVVDDTDPGVAEHGFTVQISTAHPDLSDVDFYPASGSLADVNSGFEMGVTYNPTGATTSPSGVSPDPDAVPPETDQITLIVTDTTTGLHDTVNFIFVESGSFQGNHLCGTAGKDVIFAADTGDTLTGGAGKDQFVFMPRGSGNDGQHTITDFTEGLDKIDLRQFSDVASMDDLTICQESGGTLVKWTQQIAQPNGPPVTEHESLLLQNMTATLQPTDFIFGTHIA